MERVLKQKIYKDLTPSSIAFRTLDFELTADDVRTSFETAFWKQNTNDAGEPLLPQTCQILIGEGKKHFVRKVVNCITSQKRGILKRPSAAFVRQKRYYISSSTMNSAPDSPYIDRVWKMMITYNHRTYAKLCDEVSGGYVDRVPNAPASRQPIDNTMDSIFMLENRLEKALTAKDFNERDYEVTMTPEQIQYAKEYFEKELRDAEVDEIDLGKLKEVIHKLKNQDGYKQLGLVQVVSRQQLHSDGYERHVQTLLDKICQTELPQGVLDSFASQLNLDEESVVHVFVEYAKFLVLKVLHPAEYQPSFLVDQLWREHFTWTRNYRHM